MESSSAATAPPSEHDPTGDLSNGEKTAERRAADEPLSLSSQQRLCAVAPSATSMPVTVTATTGTVPLDNAGPTGALTASAPKVVYFVRHAESAYNAYKLNPLNWLTLAALKDPMLFDPPLSPLGLSQLTALTATAAKWRLTERAQLLVVSPLKRAIDTALAVMGQPLPGAASSSGSSTSTYPLPVFVSPLCSEVVDTSADIGSPPSELSAAYPLLSFAHLPAAWWYHADPSQPRAIHDEPRERVAQRVSSFLQWLCRRPESSIVVVSHSSFIRHCTGARLKIANCQVQQCAVTQQRDGRISVTVVRDALH